MDLDLLFSGDVDARQGGQFTDRMGEAAAFDSFVAQHRARVLAGDVDVADLGAARRNVLVLYGLGGIGKTSLSERLEQRARGERGAPDWASPPTTPRITVRWTMDDALFDLEAFLLRARQATHGAFPTPTFDLALWRYWAEVHPSEDLSDVLRRLERGGDSTDRGLRDAAGEVGKAILDTAADVTGAGGVAHLAFRGGVWLAGKLRQRADQQLGRGCPRFLELIEAEDTRKLLSYLPYLLAWDVQKWAGVPPVIFLDRFEAVQETESEVLARRLAFLMPNLPVVVTGRRRLLWAEEEGPQAGRQFWPDLVPGPDTAQHLVSTLSAEDSRRYLDGVTDGAGRHILSAELVDAIVQAAGGWPLHLELSARYWVSRVQQGFAPALDDVVGLTFPDLVRRFLRDASEEERRVLCAGAVLGTFDASLLAEVARVERVAVVHRVLRTAVVERLQAGPWGIRMHDHLVDVLRGAEGDVTGWAGEDWRAAGTRATVALAARAQEFLDAGDPGGATVAVMQALSCLPDGVPPPERFVEAATALYRAGAWSTAMVTVLPEDPPVPETMADAFRLLFGAVGVRANRSNAEALTVATKLSERIDLLPPELQDGAAVFRSMVLRQLGHPEASRQLAAEVASRPGPFQRKAEQAETTALSAAGRRHEVWERLCAAPDDHEGLVGLRGGFRYHEGQWDEAISDLRAAVALAAEAGDHGHVALWTAVKSLVLGLRHGVGAAEEVDEIAALTYASGRLTRRMYGDVGRCLAGLFADPYAELAKIRAEAIDRAAVEFAAVADAAVVVLSLRDGRSAEVAYESLKSLHKDAGVGEGWVAACGLLLDRRDAPDHEWIIEDEAAVARGWRLTVDGHGAQGA